MKQILAGLLLVCAVAQADMAGTDGTDRSPSSKTTHTTDFSRAHVSFELLGSGVLYSLWGSYRVVEKLAFNLGLSYWGADISTTTGTTSSNFLLVPVSASLLLGGGNHNFEVLAGGVIVTGTTVGTGTTNANKISGAGFMPNFGIGYRYWPLDGGFHFRFLIEMFIASSSVLPWMGLSFGYAF